MLAQIHEDSANYLQLLSLPSILLIVFTSINWTALTHPISNNNQLQPTTIRQNLNPQKKFKKKNHIFRHK